MPIQDPQRLLDGFNDLSAGMDSSRSPEAIGPSSYALGINVVSRTGWPQTRPSFARHLFSPADVWEQFASSHFQGSETYYNPSTGMQRVLAVSGGRIYVLDLSRFSIEEITLENQPNAPTLPHYLCQAESFMIIQNGKNKPLIYDGENLRRAGEEEVPIGTLMIYGQGRLFVVSPDFSSFVAGDLIYGGSTTQIAINISERIETTGKGNKASIELKCKIYTKEPHKLKEGDVVTITGHSSTPDINGTWVVFDMGETHFHVAVDLVAPGLGGRVLKAQEGAESDLLRFTETTYLNEKGKFRLPAVMGRITGLTFYAVQDTGTGQGDLLVFGERGAASFAVSAPRETWLDIAIQRVALAEIGATSHDSLVMVNGDVFFRSGDGLRSYRNARAEISGYGHTSLSAEMTRVLERDSAPELDKASAVLFDNRLLLTSSPLVLPPADGNPAGAVTTVFRSLTVLDFHTTSRISQKGAPAYDGIWTGVNVLKLLSVRSGSMDRCIVFAHDMSAGRTEIWEIQRSSPLGVDTVMVRAGSETRVVAKPIGCALETRAFKFQTELSLKKLMRCDLWLADLLGEARVRLFWRPDLHPRWFYWTGFEVDVEERADDRPVNCQNPPTAKLPGISPQVALGTPPWIEDKDVTNRLADRGYTFQLRIEWDGRATIQKVLLHVDTMVEQAGASCPNILPRAIRKCVNPSPGDPVPAGLFAHSSV